MQKPPWLYLLKSVYPFNTNKIILIGGYTKAFLMRTQILFFLTVSSLLFTTVTAGFKFNEEGKFTILQLTDLHFCHRMKNETRQQTNAVDIQTQKLQRILIQIAKPDLIVLSGDAITGRRGAKTSGKEFEHCWKKVTKVIKQFKIPYAYILGNHDAEGFWDRKDIMKFDRKQELSIRKTHLGIPDTCNFFVPIFSSRNEQKLAANLWMFDSGSQSCSGFNYHTWGCIEQDVIDWYNFQSQNIKDEYGTDVHHLAFMHIPLPEFTELANHGEFSGVREEQIGCPNINTGFFNHIKRNGDISGIFVGHDHKNNMAGWYEGVELVYGQKSGYGAYGFERGARAITLKEIYDGQSELRVSRSHYIIFENETIAIPTFPRRDDRGLIAACPIYGKTKIQKILGSFKRSFWGIKNWIKQMIA